MAIESTLLIVKPDGVRRGLIGEVLRRVEAKGLRIAEMRMMQIDRSLAEEHYGEHSEKPFFGGARRVHHVGTRRRRADRGRGGDRRVAHADGSDEPGERAARDDPRRLRPRSSPRTSFTAATRRPRPSAS